jgi:hypothetical protein
MSPVVKAFIVGAVAAGAAHIVVDKFINPTLGSKIPDALKPAIPALVGGLLAIGASKVL